MKKAVAYLIPFMETEKQERLKHDPTATQDSNNGTIVLATVKVFSLLSKSLHAERETYMILERISLELYYNVIITK